MTDAPPFDVRPVVLEGRHVRLEPLERRHADDLLVASADDGVWRYLADRRPESREDVERYIAGATSAPRGEQVPFAQVELASGRAVGSTRYFDIHRPERALEIGHTWIGRPWWGSLVNVEAKLLLMTHAFETLGARRVQLKTDGRNLRSQGAMTKLGFTREGTLRRHLLLPDGHQRDSVYFSVLDDEWAAVKASLRARLDSPPR